MREILFRGKCAYGGEWVEGFYYMQRGKYAGSKSFVYEQPTITTGIVETSGAYGERSEAIEYEVIPETIGQYTGLTDKNGKKIFEGDVVNCEWGCHEIRRFVTMDEDRRGWYPFACGDGCGCCEEEVYVPECCEVIGNIHDNPELLKGE